MAAVHGLTGDDAVLLPAPLAHVSGLLNGVLVPAAAGMRVALQQKWRPDRALDAIAADAITFLVGPPTLGAQLMAEPDVAGRAAALRLYSCGGAGVTAEFAQRAAESLGCVVKRTYGSTEAPTVTTSWSGDPTEKGWHTDGRPTSAVELRVDDTGELHLRGPEVFARYWDDDSPLDADGWYPTGDLATLDDGWLTVTGRRKELIIRGGENVSPREVESVCASLRGVQQCVVVGYPDDLYGERVGLVVVAGSPVSLDDVQAHCAAAGLSKLKWPERVVQVSEVPTLTVGKPDRAALRSLLTHPTPSP
jgi:cyclohexanecarboxylate-CoA ligase